MRSLFLAGLLLAGLTPTVRPADAADVRMFIRHEVADYSAWRKTYDAFAGMQRRSGRCEGISSRVWRGANSPINVVEPGI